MRPQNLKIFWRKREYENVKITKRPRAYKDYANFHNVDTLTSFHPEVQLKNIESETKNRPKYLLSGLRGVKFVTTLVAEFEKIESDDATKHSTLYSN